MRNSNAIKASVVVVCLVLTFPMFTLADDQKDLAKQSQNPIGNIISLPFENNFDFGVGQEDAFVYALLTIPPGIGRDMIWSI